MKPFDGILCIGQTTWEGDFQKAVVQLMTELSARHQILFIDYQYTVKDLLMSLAGRRDVPIRKALRLVSPFTKKTVANGHNVQVWTPPLMLPTNWLPNHLHDQLVRWNVSRLIKGLRQAMKQVGITKPLVINAFNPIFGYSMLNKLDEYATIYYCFDEISVEKWMSRHGSRYEEQYIQQVDAVVTTSEALRRFKSVLQPNTFCVKNGVNFNLFHQGYKLAESINAKKPIVGYLGTSDDRIDFDLIEYCIRTMPDVTFQFIGEITRPWIVPRLSVYPNVAILPPRQPSELPALLAQMKVGMIPYACNDHTYTIYPLKINEYLAAGLPVVSTPFSILNDFEGIIELADTPEAFAQALRRALDDEDVPRLMKRLETAKANAWERRAEEFEVVIDSLSEPATLPSSVSQS